MLQWLFKNICNTLSFFVVFQVSEWVNRKHVNGRVVFGISQHKTATMQIATLALTQEEEAVSSLAAKFDDH